jgi:hypothetical protein
MKTTDTTTNAAASSAVAPAATTAAPTAALSVDTPSVAAPAVPVPLVSSVVLPDIYERRYIDPTLDFGFKRLFGQEVSKDLLLDFLNSILPDDHQIASLSFRNSERKGASAFEKDIVIDLLCVSPTGEVFIVEMQRMRQKHFLNRVVFYVCEAIRSQDPRRKKISESGEDLRTEAEKEADAYDLAPVYFVGILNFLYDGKDPQGRVRWFKDELLIRNLGLYDQNGEPASDIMKYTLVQMPRFTKTESELVTHADKWLFFLKHLKSFGDIPGILREPVFEKAFHTAEVAAMTPDERWAYMRSRDATLLSEDHTRTERREGKAEGKAEAEAAAAVKLAEAEAAAAAKLEAERAAAAAKLSEAEATAAAAKLEAERATAAAAKLAMARSMKTEGLPIATIVRITGLTPADINKL